MTTLKEMLDSLPDEDKAALNYAFENDLTHFVFLKDGRFIGVNTSKVRHLRPEINSGRWSAGRRADDRQRV